jgi:hypothetical protein
MHPFSMEVLKAGIIVDEIELSNKKCYIFGRQRDAVDVPMDHPSCN